MASGDIFAYKQSELTELGDQVYNEGRKSLQFFKLFVYNML